MDEMDTVSSESTSKKNYGITVPSKIIEELKRIQQRLMELVDGDEELASNIIEYSLLLGKGKGVYRETVDNLIWKKYPKIYTSPELAGKNELFHLIYHFHNIIRLQDKSVKEYILKNAPKKERDNFTKQFCEIIDKEVIRIFYPGDTEDNKGETSTIGEITEQLNDIDI